MAKTKTIFVCQNCGTQSPRWVGKCPGCESWNSFVEETSQPDVSHIPRAAAVSFEEKPVLLSQVQTRQQPRLTTGMKEFDRVMGGGIVPGSVTLIGGDPGIGKSTLSLQIANSLSDRKMTVLYVSGEESVDQTSMRAQRLDSKAGRPLYIVNQINLSVVLGYIEELKPSVVIIDSIQVLYHPDISSTPGSVSQVRECSAILTNMAKTRGVSVFIIGHVTKEGTIAGPRVLEHIVDTVLYFEGERYSSYRLLRAVKNRFGSTNEIGIFEMMSSGLTEVSNPSEIFLAERPKRASGSVVVPVMEGTRPLLVEIQGLVSRSSFGVMRNKAQGFDVNRLALLIAVLEKRIGLNLQDRDVFVNVVGGIRVEDPAADLAVITAVASAYLDKTLAFTTALVGEVGLSSEIRSVSHLASRVAEADKLGFTRCLVPKHNLKNKLEIKTKNVEIVPVETVSQAMQELE